jgi:hypothetical protein
MSTRASHLMKPWPRHFRVTVPAPVKFADLPLFKTPLNPGPLTEQETCGLGVSETPLRQVTVAGPEISVLAGCSPPLSEVACRACTFPGRARCALLRGGVMNIIANRHSNTTENNGLIAHLR